eukprot:723704-Hanusia_phi.AAC.1
MTRQRQARPTILARSDGTWEEDCVGRGAMEEVSDRQESVRGGGDRMGEGHGTQTKGDSETHHSANGIDRKKLLALETVMRICGNDFQTASKLLGEEWKEKDIYRFMKDQGWLEMLHKLAVSNSAENHDNPKSTDVAENRSAVDAIGNGEETDICGEHVDGVSSDLKNRLSFVFYEDELKHDIHSSVLTHEKRRKIQKVPVRPGPCLC